MPKLTDTQLVILSAAAQHDGGAILPLPPSLTFNKGAAASVFKSLVKRGLVAEEPATHYQEAWREAKDGRRMTLIITEAGLDAIGIEPDRQAKSSGSSTKSPRRHKKAAPKAAPPIARPRTKQALLIELLERKDGASIAEIGEATGWQPHSVRGAISGTIKKKLGLTVASETVGDRGRVYRIVTGA